MQNEEATATLSETPTLRARVEFPLRAAALDVGSNAIRYTIAEFSDIDHSRELEEQRFPVRLGHDAFTTGQLSPATLAAAVDAAIRFRQRLDDLGIGHYRAVATSAVRESRNGSELVDRIRRESGIHLETITGSEEARLVWLAVRHRIALDRLRWVLADLGGGSVEVSVVDREGIQWSESHPMGTVRLLEELSGGGEADFRRLVERYIARLSLPTGSDGAVEGVIITGGNAEALADLAAPTEAQGVTELHRADLGGLLRRLSAMTFAERVEGLGLRPDRADVIVPAAIIYDRIAELAGSDRIMVPRVGVKEGVLFDLAADLAEHRQHELELDRVTLAGAIALGRRYRFDEKHARHVADLALSLFDQLEPLHRMDEACKRRLASAALLHDIGQYVSYRRHQKHSWYLVTHSELPGLSPAEIRIVAMVTRYHRRSEPREYHEGYSDLAPAEREEVQKLAGILRVADALDREHRQSVKRIRVEAGRGRVTLQLETTQDPLLEQWALRKKAPLFEKVFGVKLQVG